MSDFELEPLIDEPNHEIVYRRPAWVEIDLEAIRHNVRTIKRMAGDGVRFMAVVKADGYGHGAVRVARAALEAGADWLGVALVEEGVELRENGITAPILVLSESSPSAASLAVEYDLATTVCSEETARVLSLEAVRQGKQARVHLKVDTGMNRIGVPPDRVGEVAVRLLTMPNLFFEGLFTHFARADEPDNELTDLQIERFCLSCASLPKDAHPIIHAANSAATLLHPRSRFEMVRIGIALYGLHPSMETVGKVDLRPAFSLKARPSFIKKVAAGEGVSYGHTRKLERNSIVVTVPVGYGDGYSRRLSNIGEVLIGGRRFSILGNVCMDQFMVDMGQNECYPEDEIVLIGRQGDEEITADEIAGLLGTINYEIVCMVNRRVPRIYLNE